MLLVYGIRLGHPHINLSGSGLSLLSLIRLSFSSIEFRRLDSWFFLKIVCCCCLATVRTCDSMCSIAQFYDLNQDKKFNNWCRHIRSKTCFTPCSCVVKRTKRLFYEKDSEICACCFLLEASFN